MPQQSINTLLRDTIVLEMSSYHFEVPTDNNPTTAYPFNSVITHTNLIFARTQV